jgi:DNA-binding HxlR family transcriptional regulator
MPVEGKLECPCPPAGTIDVVGKKWALCVVTLLGKYGTLRFGPIHRAMPHVSPATLTATLRSLEKSGLILRVPVVGDKRATKAYDLTGPGLELYGALLPLTRWLRAPRQSTLLPMVAGSRRPSRA